MMRRVAMLDLAAEFDVFEEEIHEAIEKVLRSQQFIGGPPVGELEEALAKRFGVAHAVGVGSGTDALLCALMAMGISQGAEVIVPAFTFFAAAGSVVRAGATPVFVDIDPKTFNIDPAAIEAAITERTKAIMPVHLFGQCAEMDAINEIAARRGLRVIEDACQAIGATYKGRFAGTLGNVACLSFYPTKNLGGYGEGGMVLSNDPALAEIVRQLRNHGESQRYFHERVGGNFRLDTLQAAVLLVKLRYLDEFTQRRQDNAERYGELLAGLPVTRPYVPDYQVPVYHQYSIVCDRRDELQEHLRENGVATIVYYPLPLHLQKCFAGLGYRRGSLPVAEKTCYAILSLPCHPMLSEADLEYVASRIRQFYGVPEHAAAATTPATGGNGVRS